MPLGNHSNAGSEVDCQTFPQREGIQAWRSAKQFANLLGVPLSGIGAGGVAGWSKHVGPGVAQPLVALRAISWTEEDRQRLLRLKAMRTYLFQGLPMLWAECCQLESPE